MDTEKGLSMTEFYTFYSIEETESARRIEKGWYNSNQETGAW